MNNSYQFLSRMLSDKYRPLHHAMFMGLIVFFWFLFHIHRTAGFGDLLRLVLYASTYIAIAYLNIYVLFPRFLLKGKIGKYTILSVLTFAASYFTQALIYFSDCEKLRQELTPSWLLAADMLINAITYCMFIGIGLSVKMLKMWVRSELRINSLEKENLKANLHQLKSQVSPHFLFNTFNNLYILTKTDPAIAADMLLGFADLMRYKLNECEKDKVRLEKEISYIENFLVLEKLRKNELDLKIEYDKREVAGVMIEPLLFVCLVENAVKHGSQQMEKAFIHVSIARTNGRLNFRVENSRPEVSTLSHERSLGHGLPNLRKRLDLSYPGRHSLKVEERAEQFNAELEIELS
jgi:two-component system, LytTR family, sensor kinase